jgi:GNAT superfamily N-acetyltransferase
MTAEEIIAFQRLVRQVPVSDTVARYAVRLVGASRPGSDAAPEFVNRWVTWGASLRASQFLVLGGKARAALRGRYNVSCEDVRAVAPAVLRHRVLLNFQAEAERVDSDQVIRKLIEAVPEPKSGLSMDYRIRRATLEDRAALEQLIAESARGLSRGDYSDAQVEAALASVFGVDTDLIRDGTYYVAEAGGRPVGCGGWSKRKTLFGGDRFAARDSGELDPQTEPAKIRAFFVHPDWARRGVAGAILETCERAASAEGFRALELMATLPGVRLYAARGYEAGARVEYETPGGVRIELVPMRKELKGDDG